MKQNIVMALQQLGADRVEATLVSYLADVRTASTHDIVDATGLRQPEVSIGMRRLRERGWIEAEPIPREGKGRPMNRYHLRADLPDLVGHYRSHAEQSIEAYTKALGSVEKMLKA